MSVGFVTHDEAMIKGFINDPEYADFYLSEVLKDGSDYEIQRTQYWYNEAKARSLEPAAMA